MSLKSTIFDGWQGIEQHDLVDSESHISFCQLEKLI